jgi:E3 ubiquitin-protein ligase BRE1
LLVQTNECIATLQTGECGHLAARCADQTAELNLLKAEVQAVQNNEQELSLFLSMLNRESSDPREVIELQLAERRAWAQVERLKAALDEHSLELRVKAANEAEAACQQRLTAAEAEITELQQSLDASDRFEIFQVEAVHILHNC